MRRTSYRRNTQPLHHRKSPGKSLAVKVAKVMKVVQEVRELAEEAEEVMVRETEEAKDLVDSGTVQRCRPKSASKEI